MTRLSRRSMLAAGALGALAPRLAGAADYPARTVRVVVPFPAGGTVDPPARVIAEAMSRIAGQSFVIDNRSGAGGNIGADNVAKSEPDGYTLLASNGSMPVSQVLYPSLPWNVETSFAFAGNFATLPSVLVVNKEKVPARTLADFIAFANAQQQELDYGSPGAGTASHLAAEMIKDRVKVKMRHIPYRGAAPASTDLLGGRIAVMVAGLSTVAPLLAGGQVVAIAVTSPGRAPQIPQVPAIGETFPGFDFTTWLGLAGPAGMPQPVVDRISGLMKEALGQAAVKNRLIEIGVTPEFTDAAGAMKRVREEVVAFRDIARRASITLGQ